jgi:hypothetical protein
MEGRVLIKLATLTLGLTLLGMAIVSPAASADEPTKQECIAANEAAQGMRQAGRLREARSKLSTCMATSCPGPVREDCGQRLEDLQRAIPTVVFDVKDAAGHDLLDVALSIDGHPAGTAGVTAVPLDPGPHAFRFETADAPAVDKRIVLHEGEKERRVVVVIGKAPAVAPVAPSEREGGGNAQPSPPPLGEKAEPSTTGQGDVQRMAGWLTGGAGVVVMGVGIAVALAAKSAYDGAPGCSGTQCTTSDGIDASNSARGTGNVATGVFVVGAAATTAGVVLWLTAPRQQSTASAGSTLGFGLTLGGALARGTF